MGIALPAQQLLVSTLSLLYKQAQVIMTSKSETVEKPIAVEEVKKAPAVKKSKKAVKAAPTGEKTPSYQAMVKQAVVETKSRTGSSLNTVKKFVIGKFPVDAVKAPAKILKAVNALMAAGELVPAAPPEKGVKKAGVGPSKAAEPKVSKPKTAKKVAKPKSAKADKAAPKKSAKKASATKKPSEKAAASKKPSKKATAAKKTVKKTSVKKATKKVSSAKATKKASA